MLEQRPNSQRAETSHRFRRESFVIFLWLIRKTAQDDTMSADTGGGYWKELYCVNTKTEPHYPSLGPHLTWINALSRTFPQGLSVRHSCLQCQSDRPSPASRRNQTTGLETVSSSEWKTRDKNEETAPTFLPDRAGFSQTTLRAVLPQTPHRFLAAACLLCSFICRPSYQTELTYNGGIK